MNLVALVLHFLQRCQHTIKPSLVTSRGRCSTCNANSKFVSKASWLRDHFRCVKCHSIPRERALMRVIEDWFPDWKKMSIHESSPANRGASVRLRNECHNYIASQYFPDGEPGSVQDGLRCEDFRNLTFADESIDLHVSQDVMEHVFESERVFAEIARTLKPGGAHVFTVPIVQKHKPSKIRASLNDGEIVHHEKPDYHGNPVSAEGSLVVTEWGYDICKHIFDASGLFTYVIQIDDVEQGIRAEYIDVLVTVKPADAAHAFFEKEFEADARIMTTTRRKTDG